MAFDSIMWSSLYDTWMMSTVTAPIIICLTDRVAGSNNLRTEKELRTIRTNMHTMSNYTCLIAFLRSRWLSSLKMFIAYLTKCLYILNLLNFGNFLNDGAHREMGAHPIILWGSAGWCAEISHPDFLWQMSITSCSKFFFLIKNQLRPLENTPHRTHNLM